MIFFNFLYYYLEMRFLLWDIVFLWDYFNLFIIKWNCLDSIGQLKTKPKFKQMIISLIEIYWVNNFESINLFREFFYFILFYFIFLFVLSSNIWISMHLNIWMHWQIFYVISFVMRNKGIIFIIKINMLCFKWQS